jgi:predicted dehydrogenase
MFRFKLAVTLTALFLLTGAAAHLLAQEGPFRIGVVGLVHGHVGGFFNQALKRTDVQIVGIAEPDRALFDRYAAKYKLNADLYFPSLDALLKAAHPEAVVLYTSTFGHRAAVETCSRSHVPVMMEKPLAVSYQDALAMADAARTGHIHVLVNYETTWYASNKQLKDLLQQGQLGDLRKMVFRDGHQGPREIHVQPEFFNWLTDPKLNGAGALFDFGCYGADIGTWLMNGQEPVSVTAVTRRIKPSIYPHVDDEADVIVAYPNAVAILQGSWNWPYAIKDGVVYGTTASAQTILRDKVAIQREHQTAPDVRDSKPLETPEDDNLHLFAAIVRNRIPDDENSLSGLKTNLIVTQILDAARQSAETGRTIPLPLK